MEQTRCPGMQQAFRALRHSSLGSTELSPTAHILAAPSACLQVLRRKAARRAKKRNPCLRLLRAEAHGELHRDAIEVRILWRVHACVGGVLCISGGAC